MSTKALEGNDQPPSGLFESFQSGGTHQRFLVFFGAVAWYGAIVAAVGGAAMIAHGVNAWGNHAVLITAIGGATLLMGAGAFCLQLYLKHRREEETKTDRQRYLEKLDWQNLGQVRANVGQEYRNHIDTIIAHVHEHMEDGDYQYFTHNLGDNKPPVYSYVHIKNNAVQHETLMTQAAYKANQQQNKHVQKANIELRADGSKIPFVGGLRAILNQAKNSEKYTNTIIAHIQNQMQPGDSQVFQIKKDHLNNDNYEYVYVAINNNNRAVSNMEFMDKTRFNQWVGSHKVSIDSSAHPNIQIQPDGKIAIRPREQKTASPPPPSSPPRIPVAQPQPETGSATPVHQGREVAEQLAAARADSLASIRNNTLRRHAETMDKLFVSVFRHKHLLGEDTFSVIRTDSHGLIDVKEGISEQEAEVYATNFKEGYTRTDKTI